jgi:hypothetical protein
MKVTIKGSLILSTTLAVFPLGSIAAVTPEEAAQLGKTLTQFGAQIAGNADGSIPRYSGGLHTPPPGFVPDSGFWKNPFPDERPLLRIDASNVDKYADKLSAGQIAMLKKYPKTFYMDVFPSHRTAAFPDGMLQASVRNATTCNTIEGGLGVDVSCRGGIPFPIPKTGNELMWNQQLRYQQVTTTQSSRSWIVSSNGDIIVSAEQKTYFELPYYFDDLDGRDPQNYLNTWTHTLGPTRKAGELTGLSDYMNPVRNPRKAWSYTPGLRRVKSSPEFSYDTPVSSMGGVTLFDELFVFSGIMDRFDFELVGKKEMYIPYNAYQLYFECPIEDQFMPDHFNPKCWRWELHRVWEVRATLKPGKRHVYSSRTYYFDEDTYGAGLYDAFDKNGQLYRSIFNAGVQLYDAKAPYTVKNAVIDFNKKMYAIINDGLKGGYRVSEPLSGRDLQPEVIVSKHTAR